MDEPHVSTSGQADLNANKPRCPSVRLKTTPLMTQSMPLLGVTYTKHLSTHPRTNGE